MSALDVTYTWVPLPEPRVVPTVNTTIIARSEEAIRGGDPGHLLVTVPIISVDGMTPEEQAALVV